MTATRGAHPARVLHLAVTALVVVLVVVLAGGTTGASAADDAARAGAPGAQAAPRLVDYGAGVEVRRASGQLDRLRRTSPSFRRHVARRLDAMARRLGPGCGRAPAVTVYRWRSDGFAKAAELSDGRGGCEGGGIGLALYRRVGGDWRFSLGAQDNPLCRALVRRDFPAAVFDGDCFPSYDRPAVRYRGPDRSYRGPRHHA